MHEMKKISGYTSLVSLDERVQRRTIPCPRCSNRRGTIRYEHVHMRPLRFCPYTYMGHGTHESGQSVHYFTVQIGTSPTRLRLGESEPMFGALI
jgi:hypothetical protein